MRKSLLAVVVLTLITAGCDIGLGTDVIEGNGNVVTETRAVTGVRGIALETIGAVTVVLEGADSLELTGESNLLDRIITELDGTTLRIRTEDGISLRATEPLTIRVGVEALDHLVLASSGTIQADSLLVDGLSVVNSGSGSVALGDVTAGGVSTVVSGSGGVAITDLTAADIQTTVSGSGPFSAAGTATNHNLVVSGAGALQAPGLATNRVDAVVSGSGSAVVRVSVFLGVVISGSGSLSYYGSPTVSQTITGSGSVQRLGD